MTTTNGQRATRHLRAIPLVAPQPLIDVVIDNAASWYYRRNTKPQAPLYSDLDDTAKEEYRKHVAPIVIGALEDALDLGLHREGDRR